MKNYVEPTVCELCGARFQFGPHLYDGKHTRCYSLTICARCWDGNRDGYGPAVEKQFLAHLKAHGIPVPPRNAHGCFPRE